MKSLLLSLPLFLSSQVFSQNTVELVRDILPGTTSSSPKDLVAYKGKIYFWVSSYSLWETDGTETGTSQLVSITDSLGAYVPNSFAATDDELCFLTRMPGALNTYTVWRSTGEPGNASPVATFNYQTQPFDTAVIFQNKAWFTFGHHLCYFDSGLDSMVVFYLADNSTYIENLTPIGDKLYWFSSIAQNVIVYGLYLFAIEDQNPEIQQVEHIGEAYSTPAGGVGYETSIQDWKGKLQWTAVRKVFGNGLAEVTGRSYGEGFPVFNTASPAEIRSAALTDNAFFVYACDYPFSLFSQSRLYATTGFSFENLLPDTFSETVRLTATSKRVFFSGFKIPNPATGYDPLGHELWTSDGTPAGTYVVKDINPGTGGSSPSDFLVCGDAVIFSATDPEGRALWISDGTEAGTSKLAHLPDVYSTLQNPIFFGDWLLFTMSTPEYGRELWRLAINCGQSVSIKEKIQTAPGFDFSLLPNPTQNQSVRLKTKNLTAPFNVFISQTNGRVIWQSKIQFTENETTLPTSNLPPGVYFVTIEKNGWRATKKLVVAR